MSNDLQLAALTVGELLLFAQSEDGPFGRHPAIRSFWCGELAARWRLSGPVSRIDFMTMAMCKRPAELATPAEIALFKGIENNHLLSGGWATEVIHPGNFAAFAEKDPRLIDAVESALRTTLTQTAEAKICAVIPDRKPEKNKPRCVLWLHLRRQGYVFPIRCHAASRRRPLLPHR